jgi:hypothetical protein
MTGHLMPDRIDDIDVIDAWKIRRDMELEQAAQEKEKSTAATVE